MRTIARVGDREFPIEIGRRGDRLTVRVAGRERAVEARRHGASLLLTIDGRSMEAIVVREPAPREYTVSIDGRDYPVRLLDPLRASIDAPGAAQGGRAEVRSFMPGKIVAVLVKEGQEVRSGQGLLVVEAMKMENEIAAPRDGRVSALRVRPGQTVETGAILAVVE